MTAYQHALLAVDLSEEATALARRACALAGTIGFQLSIVHALEPFSLAYGGEIPMDLSPVQKQLDDHARARLEKLAEAIEIPKERVHTVTGHPRDEIRRTAREIHADLIIVGAHHRHWFDTLFGSTTDDIVHEAHCDVLTVHVEKDQARGG